MKKNTKFKALVAMCLATLVVVAMAACSSTASTDSTGSEAATTSATSGDYTLITDGTLTVMSDFSFPPFDYMDGDNPVGFDVDVMTAVAEKLGLEIKYLEPHSFDTIIPSIVQGGKADCSCAAFTITDERAEEIDFTTPYIDSNLGVVVKNDSSAASSTDLNKSGLKVVVQSGSSSEDWARENLPEATIVTVSDPVEGCTGVQQGLYDGMVTDLPVAQYLVSNSYTDCKVIEEIPTGEQYGIVVSKDNPALTKAINEALADMEADGTMDSIEEKWFGTTL